MATIEYELAAVLAGARFTSRQANALSMRLGWDGGGGATLADAGVAEGYTRERVRQLEDRLREHLAARRQRLPLTRRALDLVHTLAPAPRREVAGRLASAGIAERPFDPAGLLRAAEFAGLRTALVATDRLLLREPDGARIKLAGTAARRLARRSGAVKVRALAEVVGGDASPGRVRNLIALDPGIRPLDAAGLWFTVPGLGSYTASGVGKMLAVADSLGVAEIDEGLRRMWRPIRLPRPILRLYCESLPWLRVDAATDSVSALQRPDPSAVLTPLEQTLVRLFRTEGPVLRFGEAVQLAQAAGANPNSASVYLSRSPVLVTLERGRYALRGDRSRA